MDTTPAPPPLARFRAELYQDGLGRRRDAQCELLDAVLTGDGPASLVRRSLAPPFRRRWPSACDAIADGTLDAAALRRLCVRALPPPPPGGRPLWAVDGTTWPRPAAKASPERTWARFVTGGQPQEGVIPGWEYQWLAAVPEDAGSWVLPLDVARRDPAAGTPTELAIAQLRAALAARAPGAPRPVVALDSHYRLAELARAGLGADLLARLARNRCFARRPGPYGGLGARPKHGDRFKLADPGTHGGPDRSARADDPERGWVRVDVWERLHARRDPDVELAVVRVTVGKLPRRDSPPEPLWLAWAGGPLPADLLQLWRWYERRFAIEHAFRFLKQALGWTAPLLRDPAAADRWSRLLAAGLWQLWLARPLVADARLPWERPAPPGRLSPGRVRRAFVGLWAALGTPAREPRPRGKSPGRQPGQRPPPPPRFPVHKRGPPTAA